MRVIEDREKPVPQTNALLGVTVYLSATEAEFIQKYAKNHCHSCKQGSNFTWSGSSMLDDLVRQIQQVKL